MEMFQELAEPFTDEEIEWRTSRMGRTDKGIWAIIVPYITSRAIMNRLDEVVGPMNWSDEYRGIGDGVLCKLGIRISDQWYYKEDAADFTNIETTKGGISDALKRAAVKWGMGRYLYTLDEVFLGGADITEGYPPKKEHVVKLYSKKDGINAWAYPPSLNGGEKKNQPKAKNDVRQDLINEIGEIMKGDWTEEEKETVRKKIKFVKTNQTMKALRDEWKQKLEGKLGGKDIPF